MYTLRKSRDRVNCEKKLPQVFHPAFFSCRSGIGEGNDMPLQGSSVQRKYLPTRPHYCSTNRRDVVVAMDNFAKSLIIAKIDSTKETDHKSLPML